jgi:hypothetical protein
MATSFHEHVRSLALLHDLIERDQDVGEKGAIEKLVKDIAHAAERIAADGEHAIELVNAEANAAANNLKAEARVAVGEIRRGAAQAAAELLRNVEEGADEKTAVLAADRILKQAEQTTVELNMQAQKALKALAQHAIEATEIIQNEIDSAFKDLAVVKEVAVKQVVGAAKDTARQFPADAAPDDPQTRAARQAAANVIKMLAQASESVHRSANSAASRLQKAAFAAITSVKTASSEAASSVHDTIDQANRDVLAVTKEAIAKTIGSEEKAAQFFDLESLRDKWSKRS